MRPMCALFVVLLAGLLPAACMSSEDDETATPTEAVAATATTAGVAEITAPSIPATATAPAIAGAPTARLAQATSPTASRPVASPTPRATVAAPIRPIATQQPAATATTTDGAAQAVTLELVQQGFSEVQAYDEVAYGFIVQNPDAVNAVINSDFRVTVYQNGEALETDSGTLDSMLPGQRVGVGGSVFISSGRDADSIAVELTAGEATVADLDPGFSVSRVAYYSEGLFPSATGVVGTTYSQPLQDFEVFAVAYDAAGAIVGGGYTFVSFITAGGTTGVEVNVSSAGEPDRVELYPIVTSLTIFGLAGTTSSDARPLTIVAEGFVPSRFENELGWGFVVANPNTGLAAETTAYQVTAYAADGTVLGVYSSYISLLLPDERLGLGGSLYLPAGTTVERLEFDVLGRYFRETEIRADFLTTAGVTYVGDEFSPRVTGTVQNSLERELRDVEVYVIAYNAAGQIVGGGFAFVDLIQAGGQASADVTIAVGEDPATVELFATVGSLSDIE